jgi:ATP-dependent DNA ligase
MPFEISELQVYDLCDQPSEDSKIVEWRYPAMYKLDAKGVRREWFGCVYDGCIITSHGTADGVKTISEPYKVELNASGRSFITQASLELRSRYEVKNRKEGYRFPGEITTFNVKPMLAESWDKRRPSTVLHYPVAIQPKLDGIRCLVKEDPETGIIRYRSRTNKLYDFNYLFDEEISAMLPFFPFQVEFDGEMYIHGMKLQGIASIVALKSTPEDLKQLKGKKKEHAEETLKLREDLLKYNIFTLITAKELPYEDRNDILRKAYEQGEISLGRKFERVVLVEDNIAESMDDIVELSDHYVNFHGYEGVMIYKLGCSLPPSKIKESYYKSSRSYNLIKYKPFYDEEMVIIAVKGGKGKAADLAGCTVRDSDGITHEVNIAEDDDVRRRIFKDPSSVIGKDATVKHYGRTDDGKLRHANIICIRDYE